MNEVRGPGSADALREASAFVRSREVLLRYCYSERGVKVDSTLTGFVAVAVHISNADRADSISVRVLSGAAWHGAAAESVNACLREKMTPWRWPASVRQGAYSFILGFVYVPAPPASSTRSPR